MRTALAVCLALLLPATAVAQPVGRDGARQLQQDLQSWLAGLLGPAWAPAPDWVHVTPQDDHFRVAVPFPGGAPLTAVTADVRPLPGGLWSVESLRLPSSARLHLHVPQPGAPAGTTVPAVLDLHIGSQHNHALIAPALTAPSRLDLDLGDVGVQTSSAHQVQVQHFDHYALQATLQPDRGRLDLLEQGSVTGWRSASRVDDKPAVGIGADRVAASSRIDGIDRAQVAALLTASAGLIAALPAGPPGQHGHVPLSPPARAALRAMIASLRGIATGVEVQEHIDGLHVAIAGKGETTAAHATIGFSGAAPDGMLHAAMLLSLDGLTVQHMLPQAAELVPQHVLLRPSVAGLSVAALSRLALAATEPRVDQAQLRADAMAVLSRGGVTAGLDAMDVALGPATFHGHGQVVVNGPDDYQARFHIDATGLDALMQQAAGDPDLQRALPLIAMARGFARPEGDHLVWDVTANPAGLTVNGVPLGGGNRPQRP